LVHHYAALFVQRLFWDFPDAAVGSMEGVLNTAQTILTGYDVTLQRQIRSEERTWRVEDLTYRQHEKEVASQELQFMYAGGAHSGRKDTHKKAYKSLPIEMARCHVRVPTVRPLPGASPLTLAKWGSRDHGVAINVYSYWRYLPG
ncbi:hypothetical protein Vafri_1575, partial [Volvox africanus]